MKCPICDGLGQEVHTTDYCYPVVVQHNERIENFEEIYDKTIFEFICTKNKEHRFYVSMPQWRQRNNGS